MPMTQHCPPRWFTIACLSLVLASAAWAHHSQVQFDFKSLVDVEGTVKELDWRSPHARLYVDVADAQGQLTNWNFELPSPMTLMRRGWKRDSLKPGEKVKVKAARARHVADIGYAIAVRDAAGKPLFTGVTQIYEPETDSKSPPER
ncbi:MAG: DUF6152 family protein [Steroidobacteraceae bacterium]